MKYLLLCLSLFLTACVTTVADQNNALSQKNLCCSSVIDIDYQMLASTKTALFELNEQGAPVYDFGSGKTYFAALEIPSELQNSNIRVKSYFNGMFIGQYMQPYLMFLDSEFNSLGQGTMDLTFYDASFGNGGDAHLLGGKRTPENTRYVIVYTRAPFKKGAYVTLSDGTALQLENSPTGKIELTFY